MFSKVIRVLGVLGALDPHKHKMNQGLIQKGEAGAVLSISDPKPGQESSQTGQYWNNAQCLQRF